MEVLLLFVDQASRVSCTIDLPNLPWNLVTTLRGTVVFRLSSFVNMSMNHRVNRRASTSKTVVEAWQGKIREGSSPGDGIQYAFHFAQHPPIRRRADEVQKVSATECLYTTSLETSHEGSIFATGTMFTLVPNSPIDILTLEFDAQIDTLMAAKVYYKEGDFSGSTSDQSQWTMLADTAAQVAPGDTGAIIPTGDFTPATLTAGTKYSFYLHLESGNTILKVQSGGDTLIGDDAFTDPLGIMTLQTGVSLNEGPFPTTFGEAVQFSGRLHYRTSQDCNSVRTSTIVELEFAVNENPEEAVMSALSDSVKKSIDAIIILDPDLIKYEKFHSLEIANVEAAFMGRSGELAV